MELPKVVETQKAFIRKVIDTLNDLDNVLWEIVNEMPNDYRALLWHYHMVDYVRAYESTKPKQHPVGMTAEGGTQDNPLLFASSADWISPGFGPSSQYMYDPPAANGRKVIISDTDHLWGGGGSYRWAWKSFLRGLNPIFMDFWTPLPGAIDARTAPGLDLKNQRDYPDWQLLRQNLGYTRRYARRVDLLHMAPREDLASSRYCLANPGKEYLVYVPEDAFVRVTVDPAPARLLAEWFDPKTGRTAAPVEFAPAHTPAWTRNQHLFVSPFGTDSVLYLRAGL